jgi:hypothetical protein
MSTRSPRKKWRIKIYPSYNYATASSMKGVYELANTLRDQYAANLTGIHQVDIEMNDGEGWALWERCEFPKREESAGDE